MFTRLACSDLCLTNEVGEFANKLCSGILRQHSVFILCEKFWGLL